MKKVICVVGPTASGKTELAINLAKKFNCPIVSCDSVAVYKDLNIGSAKPSQEELKQAKHYLIDVLEPTEQFDVATCQKMAREIIEKEDLVILCGGTGLYIQSIINNYEFEAPKRNDNFAKKYHNYSNDELFSLLEKFDYEKTKTIHPNNRKRVLRALESALSGKNLSEYNKKQEPIYDAYIIYLDMPRDLLYERINKRVDLMIEAGLIDEVKDLYNRGIHPHAIGYQEWELYFSGLESKESVIETIKKNTRHLAKRQNTWFKNQTNACFYDVSKNKEEVITTIINDVEGFLNDK